MPDELEMKAEDTASPNGNADESAENQNEDALSEEAQQESEEDRIAAEKAEEHKEKSRLGRRLSTLEEKMNDFLEKASQVLSAPRQEDQGTMTETLSDDDYLDVKTFKKLISQAETQREKTELIYAQTYEKQLKSIGASTEDEDIHMQVVKLITDDGSPFNVKSHQDPKAAAQINYYKALNHLQGKTKQKPKLKGDKDLPPAGDATKTKTKTEPEIELDEDTKAYIKIRQLNPDKVKKLMKDKTPVFMSGNLM